jgi:hypothetical protein
MKSIAFIRLSIITCLFLVFAFFFLGVSKVDGQGQQPTLLPSIQTSTPTPTALPTATATFTLDQQAGDLLKTYKEVLEASKNAVEEVHATANNVLDLVGKMFTALTIGGLGGAALLSWFGQRASDKANAAQQKAVEALDLIQKTENKTIELGKRNDSAIKVAEELAQKQIDLRLQIENAEQVMKDLQGEINQVKNMSEKDRQVLKRPLVLMQIHDHGMQLLSGSSDKRNNSITALIEMSSRPDAVVQRKSVKTLGILEEYDERVVKRMKEIIESDSAQGVRKEAEKTLKLVEAKKTKKPTRRKS